MSRRRVSYSIDDTSCGGSRYRQLIRTFRVAQRICDGPPPTMHELARAMGVTDRTIRRDLSFIDMIVPVFKEGGGSGRRSATFSFDDKSQSRMGWLKTI